jgi:hypothetical protein
MLLILGRDPIKIYSVFAIFNLSLFEDNHTLTFFSTWLEIRDSQRSGTRFHKFSSFACWLEYFEIRHAFLINIHEDGEWLAPSKFMHFPFQGCK